MGALIEMVGASFLLVMGLMALLWVVYLFKRNGSIVDIGWAVAFIIVAWTYFAVGDGMFLRKLLMALLVSFWALRLAYHLIDRYRHAPEDPRYQQLRINWGGENTNFKFLMLYLFQGLLVLILSIPFLLMALSNREWSNLEWIGVVVWICGIAGETFADYQLQQFKKENPDTTQVCQKGLWGFTRHPNYFFEWVVWIGYFLMALPAPLGWLAIVAPALMYYLLTQVSGIPMTEAEALKKKGQAYRDYQVSVSPFFPWFPKK